ncbi:MAG: hypothetical protein AAF742_01085 [Pseudomonadota bacterium]
MSGSKISLGSCRWRSLRAALLAGGLAFTTAVVFNVPAYGQSDETDINDGQNRRPGDSALPVGVEVSDLAKDVFSTGVLTPDRGGFRPEIWRDASGTDIASILLSLPTRPSSPAIGSLIERLLTSYAVKPLGAPSTLGGRKLVALAKLGYGEEVRTIASLASSNENDTLVKEALVTVDLLDGKTDSACRRADTVRAGRDALFWVKLRVLCQAAEEEYNSADLTLSLLRERGVLDASEDTVLTAVSIPAPLKLPVAPKTALEYAALSQLQGVRDPSFLSSADAGVIKSIVADTSQTPAARLAAAKQASVLGVLDGEALQAFFASFEPLDDLLVEPSGGDPLASLRAFQRIESLAAPEFVRDRAQAIANEILRAPDYPTALASSLIYDTSVQELEGIIVDPSTAGAFAVVAMVAGDAERAGNWLKEMGREGFDALGEADRLRFLELVNLLSVLDRRQAEIVAAFGNTEISDPPANGRGDAVDEEALATLAAAAVRAASLEGEGEGALVAAALASPEFVGHPVADRLSAATLSVSGLERLQRHHAFFLAWKASFPEDASGIASVPDGQEQGLSPSLKPGR